MKSLALLALGAMVSAAIPMANADPVIITPDHDRDHRIERRIIHHDQMVRRHIIHHRIMEQRMLRHDRGWHNGYWHHHHHDRTVIIKHD